MSVLIVGAGHVGLTFGLALATKGARVTFYDIDEAKIQELLKLNFNLVDSNLDLILKDNAALSRLNFIDEIPENSIFEFVVVTIGTNLDEAFHGELFLQRIRKIFDRFSNKNFHVMLRSTVAIGTSRKIYNDLIKNFPLVKLSFCPERSVEGNAINDCLNLPQLVGGINETSINQADLFFKSFGVNTILCNSTEEAEFCKLAGNVWRDALFSISNELSTIATSYAIDIHSAISKINEKYPRASIPYPGPVGGSCLTKDTQILLVDILESKYEFTGKLVGLAREINKNLIKELKKFILSYPLNEKDKTILILGLSFKGFPMTNDLRNSPMVELMDSIKNIFKIKTLDPEIDKLNFDEKSQDLIKNYLINSTIIIIGNNHPFLNDTLFYEILKNKCNDSHVVIDLWPNHRKWKISNEKFKIVRYQDWHGSQ